MKKISPQEAQRLLQDGAVLIDIRAANEFARKHIPGAQSVPVDQLAQQQIEQGKTVIFTCMSGMRTQSNQNTLSQASQACSDAFILEGGLTAWEKAGLEVKKILLNPLKLCVKYKSLLAH